MSLSFDVAHISQPVPQSFEGRPGLICENPDFPNAAGRLRNGCAWPRHGAADKLEKRTPVELAKSHLIPSVKSGPPCRVSLRQVPTWSARASQGSSRTPACRPASQRHDGGRKSSSLSLG